MSFLLKCACSLFSFLMGHRSSNNLSEAKLPFSAEFALLAKNTYNSYQPDPRVRNTWDCVNQDGGVGRHTVPPHTTRTDRESNSKGDRHQGNRK